MMHRTLSGRVCSTRYTRGTPGHPVAAAVRQVAALARNRTHRADACGGPAHADVPVEGHAAPPGGMRGQPAMGYPMACGPRRGVGAVTERFVA